MRAHGGYRQLKSFQVAQLVYDLTVRFCDRFIDRRSRTHDQMVQAARSGVQNIAEGSEAAATSNKIELKLTQIARASLEELKLDYEDFLRHRRLPCWDRYHPLRQELVDSRPTDADAVVAWVAQQAKARCAAATEPGGTDRRDASTAAGSSSGLPPASLYPEIAANAILALATVAGFLLDRQVQQLAATFEKEGGFTERLYRVRSNRRKRP
ncbi:MAG: four helix bundle protein [Opitutales bacterium]|nr:four helix bundle protein [Opitutales bacterium]